MNPERKKMRKQIDFTKIDTNVKQPKATPSEMETFATNFRKLKIMVFLPVQVQTVFVSFMQDAVKLDCLFWVYDYFKKPFNSC